MSPPQIAGFACFALVLAAASAFQEDAALLQQPGSASGLQREAPQEHAIMSRRDPVEREDFEALEERVEALEKMNEKVKTNCCSEAPPATTISVPDGDGWSTNLNAQGYTIHALDDSRVLYCSPKRDGVNGVPASKPMCTVLSITGDNEGTVNAQLTSNLAEGGNNYQTMWDFAQISTNKVLECGASTPKTNNEQRGYAGCSLLTIDDTTITADGSVEQIAENEVSSKGLRGVAVSKIGDNKAIVCYKTCRVVDASSWPPSLGPETDDWGMPGGVVLNSKANMIQLGNNRAVYCYIAENQDCKCAVLKANDDNEITVSGPITIRDPTTWGTYKIAIAALTDDRFIGCYALKDGDGQASPHCFVATVDDNGDLQVPDANSAGHKEMNSPNDGNANTYLFRMSPLTDKSTFFCRARTTPSYKYTTECTVLVSEDGSTLTSGEWVSPDSTTETGVSDYEGGDVTRFPSGKIFFCRNKDPMKDMTCRRLSTSW